MGTPSEKLIT